MSKYSLAWKKNIQVRDLAPEQQMEIVCLKCNMLRYKRGPEVDAKYQHLYLDEFENRLRCSVRGCGGRARMAVLAKPATAFVGGLA